jgi:hypothetical protein
MISKKFLSKFCDVTGLLYTAIHVAKSWHHMPAAIGTITLPAELQCHVDETDHLAILRSTAVTTSTTVATSDG